MMRFRTKGNHIWKRWTLAAALTALLLAGAACGKSPKKTETDQAAEASTQIFTEATVGESAVVADGVRLPAHFDNMPYVMEALMVQDYAKNMPYFTPNMSDQYADSFYYSMAVLTSLIEQKTVFGDGVVSGKYYYLSEDTVDKYASALYDAFGQGNMEFPELSDNSIYAIYDEDTDSYAFIIGDVGDMMVHITECSKEGDQYVIRASLYNGDDFLREYLFYLLPTSFIAEVNEFAYSVSDMKVMGEDDMTGIYDSSQNTAGTEDQMETAMDYGNSGQQVPVSEARKAAGKYAGESIKYDKTEEIDGTEYYFFRTESDEIILVDSHDVQTIFGAKENGDGSWTFDQ